MHFKLKHHLFARFTAWLLVINIETAELEKCSLKKQGDGAKKKAMPNSGYGAMLSEQKRTYSTSTWDSKKPSSKKFMK